MLSAGGGGGSFGGGSAQALEPMHWTHRPTDHHAVQVRHDRGKRQPVDAPGGC